MQPLVAYLGSLLTCTHLGYLVEAWLDFLSADEISEFGLVTDK